MHIYAHTLILTLVEWEHTWEDEPDQFQDPVDTVCKDNQRQRSKKKRTYAENKKYPIIFFSRKIYNISLLYPPAFTISSSGKMEKRVINLSFLGVKSGISFL